MQNVQSREHGVHGASSSWVGDSWPPRGNAYCIGGTGIFPFSAPVRSYSPRTMALNVVKYYDMSPGCDRLSKFSRQKKNNRITVNLECSRRTLFIISNSLPMVPCIRSFLCDRFETKEILITYAMFQHENFSILYIRMCYINSRS